MYQQRVILVITLSIISMIAAAEKLVLNDTNGPPFTNQDGSGFLDIVAHKIFASAGLELELIRMPAERALRNANDGIDDGELSRVIDIDKLYANLIRVPESIVEWKFVALARDKSVSITNWDDLKPYNVGYIRGWKILETNTLHCPNVSIVSSEVELFSMLDKGRIDIALYPKWMGLAIVENLNLQGIHALEPPLAVRDMYIYLNKKHASSVSKLDKALREMKSSGEYDKLFQQNLQSNFPKQVRQ